MGISRSFFWVIKLNSGNQDKLSSSCGQELHDLEFFLQPNVKWHPPVKGLWSWRVQTICFPNSWSNWIESVFMNSDTQWRLIIFVSWMVLRPEMSHELESPVKRVLVRLVLLLAMRYLWYLETTKSSSWGFSLFWKASIKRPFWSWNLVISVISQLSWRLKASINRFFAIVAPPFG